MNQPVDSKKNQSLAFFGKVNASISHELKNIMAVISETAGLLDDLTDAVKRGKSLEPDMLSSCSTSIVEEVQRGFATIKQMNRFAHSVDEPVAQVALKDVVELMIGLSKFLSYASIVKLESPADSDIHIETCPFVLQDIVYQTLIFGFKSVGPDGEFTVSIQPAKNNGATIVFSGLGKESDQNFPNENLLNLSVSIGAEMHRNPETGDISITVPEKM